MSSTSQTHDHVSPAAERRLRRTWSRRRRMLALRGILYPLLLCLGILGVGGVGFWMLDPDVVTLSDGLWLAFTTAATVGYGDLVPSTHASRGFAVLVVLMGLGVLSMVTAAVAALFMESEEQQVERDLMHEIQGLREQMDVLMDRLDALTAASSARDAKDSVHH